MKQDGRLGMVEHSTNSSLDASVVKANIGVIRQQLADFVITELCDGKGPTSIGHEDDLIRQGFVDSLGVLRIVGFIEQCYGVRILDEEIVVANFRTISSIAHLVAHKVKCKA